MNFIKFREKMFDLACFNIHQVLAWEPDFNRDNLTRWLKRGLLIKLRQGYYAFPEYRQKPDYAYYIANRMYRPSYISLHTALSFYGIIPEAVVQITSVSTLKTTFFKNEFGEYSYKSIKYPLFFGYDLKPMQDGRTLQFAFAEKALLDLLYLYSFYDTNQEMEELRLDDYFMHHELDIEKFKRYTLRFKSKALEKRAELLFKTYDL